MGKSWEGVELGKGVEVRIGIIDHVSLVFLPWCFEWCITLSLFWGWGAQVNMLIPLHIKENETQSPKWKASVLQGANQASNHSQNARDKAPEASSEYEFLLFCPTT